jgi:amino acid permease
MIQPSGVIAREGKRGKRGKEREERRESADLAKSCGEFLLSSMAGVELCDLPDTEREQIVGQHQSGSSEAPPPSHIGASIGSGVLNMSNTILGAGMLALPHALAQCGLLVGLLLLALFAALSLLGLHLVSAAADLAGRPSSFYAVAEKAVPGSGLLIDAAIAVKCFGVATAYLIIVGDAMPQAVEPFGATGVLLDRRLWTLGAAVLVAPLAYLKQIDALRHTSLLALLSVLFVTVLVVLFALHLGPGFDPCADRPPAAPCRGAVPLATSMSATLSALPTFVFSFTCHQNIISVTNELRAPTPRRGLTVIGAAVGLAFVQYTVLGTAALLTFGDRVESDVLRGYPASPLLSVARLSVAVLVSLSYPLQALLVTSGTPS